MEHNLNTFSRFGLRARALRSITTSNSNQSWLLTPLNFKKITKLVKPFKSNVTCSRNQKLQLR